MRFRSPTLVALTVAFLTGLSIMGMGLAQGGNAQPELKLATCQPWTIEQSIVQVTLGDRGSMMGNAPMAPSIGSSPVSVSSGVITFVATNFGTTNHELLILPLAADGAGTRPVGSGGKFNETQKLGEASTSCGAGTGDGISPGARSWVTVTLVPGRYELVCDIPWHYASGMYATFSVS